MINLRCKTGYSFREAFGRITDLLESVKEGIICITDVNTTIGFHPLINWNLKLKKNKRIIFGAEFKIVDNKKDQDVVIDDLILIATNPEGVHQLYELASKASFNKKNFGKLFIKDLDAVTYDLIAISTNIIQFKKYKINCELYFGLSPTFDPFLSFRLKGVKKIVAISDNLYYTKECRKEYLIFSNNAFLNKEDNINNRSFQNSNNYNRYLMNEEEWDKSVSGIVEKNIRELCINNIKEIVNKCDLDTVNKLVKAKLPDTDEKRTIEEICRENAPARGIDLNQEEYKKRFERELKVINSKEVFYNYFYIVSDLVLWAKQRMLVGPGRGSSSGSLVCYLMYITDIDPIKYGLFFERFLDENRNDFPDIDIDFENNEDAFRYLKLKYGEDCVEWLGKVGCMKSSNLYRLVSPYFDLSKYEDAIKQTEKRNEALSISNELDVDYDDLVDFGLTNDDAIKTLNKLYDHPQHFSKHPCGVLISNRPLVFYQAIDEDGGGLNKRVCIEGSNAETMNLLKLDCLSLNTLNQINETLKLINLKRDDLLKLDLNDTNVYEKIFQKADTTCVFQFEGSSLIDTCRRYNIKNINDIIAITSLVRPSSIRSGGVEKYIKGYIDKIKEPILKEILSETRGVMIYQEQLMKIVGQALKADPSFVNKTRKAVSKNRGPQDMELIIEDLRKEGIKNGVSQSCIDECLKIIKEGASYLFVKAHAASYSVVSYWCAWLKTYYPLEFLVSAINTSHTKDKKIKIILFLMKMGYKITYVDPVNSKANEWYYMKERNEVIGPFSNVEKIGAVMSKSIVLKRDEFIKTLNKHKHRDWLVKKLESERLKRIKNKQEKDIIAINNKFDKYISRALNEKIESKIENFSDVFVELLTTINKDTILQKQTEFSFIELDHKIWIGRDDDEDAFIKNISGPIFNEDVLFYLIDYENKVSRKEKKYIEMVAYLNKQIYSFICMEEVKDIKEGFFYVGIISSKDGEGIFVKGVNKIDTFKIKELCYGKQS